VTRPEEAARYCVKPIRYTIPNGRRDIEVSAGIPGEQHGPKEVWNHRFHGRGICRDTAPQEAGDGSDASRCTPSTDIPRMLSHSLGSTHTLHAEEVHQEPNEVVSASPQQGENTRVPRDLEVQVPPQEVHISWYCYSPEEVRKHGTTLRASPPSSPWST
jgi:hypothetical protein